MSASVSRVQHIVSAFRGTTHVDLVPTMLCDVAYRDVSLWSAVVGQHEDGLPTVGEVVCALAAVVTLAICSLRTASHFWTGLKQPEGEGVGR